jgi:transposase
MSFEAVLCPGRTGVPLRHLPGEFGQWDAVYNRWRRWVRSGTARWLFEGVTADPQVGDVRRVLVDSTTVRAHRHPAGALRPKRRSAASGPRRGRASAAAGAG